MSQIITIDDLTGYMNKSLTSTVAQQVVDAVNAYVETRTSRCWGEVKEATERVDWGSTIYLRKQDVVEITSINSGYPHDTPELMDETDYYVNSLGRLTLPGARSGRPGAGRDYLEVSYTYGSLVVPDDLKLAALGLAAGFYNWGIGSQKEIVESQVGSYRVKYAGSTNGGSDSTADANRAIIASYATKRV